MHISIAFIQNAELEWCEYQDDKYGNYKKDDQDYAYTSAIYLGDMTGELEVNMEMYINNCKIKSTRISEEVSTDILSIRNANSPSGNSMYISNCELDKKSTIRIDNNLLQLPTTYENTSFR